MNPSIWSFMDRMGFELFHYLLSVLWQSALLFSGVFLLMYSLRKRSAELRHKLLLFALLLSPFLPLLTKGIQKIGAPQQGITILSPYTESSLVPINYSKPDQRILSISPSKIDMEDFQSTASNQQLTTHNPQSTFSPGYPWAVAGICYFLGASFFLGWIIMGRLRIRRWRLDSIPCTNDRVLEIFRQARNILGVEKNILLLEGNQIPAPLSFGTFHPAIFIPQYLESHTDDEELSAIAFHETAHIKRHDPLILNLATLVRAILFFHPFVWMAVRRISNYAEMCADDAALEHTVQPLSYAKLLTRLSENLSRRPLSTEMATGLLFSKSAFLKRVEAILGDRPRLRRLSRFAIIACFLAILVSLFLSLSFPLKVKAFAEETKRQKKLSEETTRIANWRSIISSQAMEDLMELSPDGIHDEKKFKSMIVPSEEMLEFFRESQQNGNRIIFTDSIGWHYLSGSNFGWSFSTLISENRQYLAKGDGHFDAKIKKKNIQMSLNMNLDLEVGNSKIILPIVCESTLQIGKTLALFFPIEESERPLYLVMIYQPEEFSPEEVKFISHMSDTQWWLEDGHESVKRVYESFTVHPMVNLKTDLSDQNLSFSGKPLAHFDLSQKRVDKFPIIDLSIIPEDLWIAPSDQELARNKSWKFAFDQGDLCVPEPHLLLPLRYARMAPLKIPGRIRTQEPFVDRLKRMSKSDILDQISAYEKSTEEKPENGFPALSGRYYAMIGNKGDLVIIETIKHYPGNYTANFIHLGKIDPAPETVEVIQGKDRSLQGSVTDDQGNPIEGVKIINWFPFGSNPQEAWTNSKGAYYFQTRRGYVVRAYKDGYAPSFQEFHEKYYAMEEKKESLSVDFSMNKGGIVQGRILDKSSGNPLEGVNILVNRKAVDVHVGNLPYDIWTSEPIVTDKNGTFHMELVPTGLVKIKAESDGYKSGESDYLELEKGGTKSFELSLEKKTGVEIAEEKAQKEILEKWDKSLSGIVRDSSGNPMDGVKISNFFPNGSMPQETFTNAKGEFRFEQERGYTIIAEKTGFAPSFYEFKEQYYQIRREVKDLPYVEMVMTKGGSVSGVIRSEVDNNPIPNTDVWIDCWARDTDVGVNRYIIWKSQPVKTDAQGRFTLENAPEGTLRLHSDAKDLAEKVSPEFAVDPGSNKEISLDLYHGMDLRFLILDKETQAPIHGAEIYLSEKGMAHSNQNGVCLYPNVSLGKYWMRCTAPSYHEMTLNDIAIEEKQGVKDLKLLLFPVKQP